MPQGLTNHLDCALGYKRFLQLFEAADDGEDFAAALLDSHVISESFHGHDNQLDEVSTQAQARVWRLWACQRHEGLQTVV